MQMTFPKRTGQRIIIKAALMEVLISLSHALWEARVLKQGVDYYSI